MHATTRGEGVRLSWHEVPVAFAAAVAGLLGSAIVGVSDRRGGFSPGPAAVLTLADGRRAFVKACSDEVNETTVQMHRREALIVAALPPEVPAPALIGTVELDGWFGLVYEAADGRPPELPWQAEELETVFAAMTALARIEPPSSPVLRPAPEALGDLFGFWSQAAAWGPPPTLLGWSLRHLDTLAGVEANAGEATSGTSLVHCDTRADNLLINAGRVTFVDWTHAAIGAPFVDRVLFAVPCYLQGGPEPEDQVAGLAADPDAITAIVAGFTGYLTIRSLEPAPPGLPTIRQFQAELAVVARRWCAKRLGLPSP